MASIPPTRFALTQASVVNPREGIRMLLAVAESSDPYARSEPQVERDCARSTRKGAA